MRLLPLMGLVVVGVVAQPAVACPPLPAPSGSAVSVKTSWGGVKRPTRTVVRVCTGGRRVVLRRAALRAPETARRSGVIVRAASAAGRRVAWIEAGLRRGHA
jgi:hypothetical protein